MPTASGQPTKGERAPNMCHWTYACPNEAIALRSHPVLIHVKVCAEHLTDDYLNSKLQNRK